MTTIVRVRCSHRQVTRAERKLFMVIPKCALSRQSRESLFVSVVREHSTQLLESGMPIFLPAIPILVFASFFDVGKIRNIRT